MFIDRARIIVESGAGGNGMVSFRLVDPVVVMEDKAVQLLPSLIQKSTHFFLLEDVVNMRQKKEKMAGLKIVMDAQRKMYSFMYRLVHLFMMRKQMNY